MGLVQNGQQVASSGAVRSAIASQEGIGIVIDTIVRIFQVSIQVQKMCTALSSNFVSQSAIASLVEAWGRMMKFSEKTDKLVANR